MSKGKLIDPVTDGEGQGEEVGIEEYDFQAIPVTASRQAHPFDGYPMSKIKIGTYKEKGQVKDLIVFRHSLVALNPREPVFQDPSGLGVTQQLKDGGERIVNLKTYHNRCVVNGRGQNEDIVFDREIELPNGKKMSRVAVVNDHLSRSQLFFKINPRTGKVEVDTRYALLDKDQANRLRDTFKMFYYQQTQSERLAARHDAEPESVAGE